MNIGVIGAGMIGHTVAKLFVGAGHVIAISNSRGPATLGEVISDLGPNAHAATVDEAAHFGELLLLAVPWRKPRMPHYNKNLTAKEVN